MNAIARHRLSRRYAAGLDVLSGDLGVSDFIPWLGTISKVVGAAGGAGGGQQDAVKKLLEEQARQRAAEEKARAARTRTILWVIGSVLGTAALGTGAYLIFRKK